MAASATLIEVAAHPGRGNDERFAGCELASGFSLGRMTTDTWTNEDCEVDNDSADKKKWARRYRPNC